MSDTDLALRDLEVAEGFRGHAYRDIVGKLTIGYGFNVDAGISEFAAGELLRAQVVEIRQALTAFWWFKDLDAVRASVLLNVAFNCGVNGLLHFPKMLAAIGAKNWQAAHDELLDSDAARMLPHRYGPLANKLLNGV